MKSKIYGGGSSRKLQIKPNFPDSWNWGHHARTPCIVGTLNTGWNLFESKEQMKTGYKEAGSHGYNDSSESFEGLFIANGPAFKKGFVAPTFSNIHIYELLAHLIQVTPAPNDGNLDVISGMLTNDSIAQGIDH